jgi:uncharacterized protein YbjT (DUF2867 family)
MPFLITGATGDVGFRVVGLLLERGERPQVFVRDSAKKAINSHPKTDDYQIRISR